MTGISIRAHTGAYFTVISLSLEAYNSFSLILSSVRVSRAIIPVRTRVRDIFQCRASPRVFPSARERRIKFLRLHAAPAQRKARLARARALRSTAPGAGYAIALTERYPFISPRARGSSRFLGLCRDTLQRAARRHASLKTYFHMAFRELSGAIDHVFARGAEYSEVERIAVHS